MLRLSMKMEKATIFIVYIAPLAADTLLLSLMLLDVVKLIYNAGLPVCADTTVPAMGRVAKKRNFGGAVESGNQQNSWGEACGAELPEFSFKPTSDFSTTISPLYLLSKTTNAIV